MVGLLERLPKSPLHTSCEVALICISPPPNCCLAPTVCPSVFSNDVISYLAVMSISTSTCSVSETVSATPSTPIRTTRIGQTVLDQIQEGRCVSFWDKNRVGIGTIQSSKSEFYHEQNLIRLLHHLHFSIWPDLNVIFDPLLRHETGIWPTGIKIIVGLS
jgi:hypothetical protein